MSEVCGIDCNKGRELGCKSYCCRLLVRLTAEEMQPTKDGSTPKGFVDKDIKGYCIHFNKDNFNCAIWKNRPKTCQAYNCNHDYLLQVAINNPFNNIVDLVNKANVFKLPKTSYTIIPYTNDS